MQIKGKHFLVLGLGESGLAMARFLSAEGAKLRVADMRDAPAFAPDLRLRVPDAVLVTGEFSISLLEGIDAIAISPGIPLSTPLVAEAQARGIPLISEITLFMDAVRIRFTHQRVIAITGSNGKTTTTALTAHLLHQAGIPAIACGNISPSALTALMGVEDHLPEFPRSPKVWVLELSSFQLETTPNLGADAATILNISEDHLDRHGSLYGYIAAKARIFEGARARVVNLDEKWHYKWRQDAPWLVGFSLNAPASPSDFGLKDGWLCRGEEQLFSQNALPISGTHNAANALAALALCEAIGVEVRRVLPALASFQGLAHRVEKIGALNGVSFYDDSKGTNVGASLAAISGLGTKVCVILGGEGKGQDFSPLKDPLATHAKGVALIGRDAALIEEAIMGIAAPIHTFPSLEDAVDWCASYAEAGEAVLLSPACASFDMFQNYAHRAAVFKARFAVLQERGGA